MTLLMMALVFLGVLVDGVQAADNLLVSGACGDKLNGLFWPVERTASGRWWYLSTTNAASLYWDDDCNGANSGGTDMWIFDNSMPSAVAESDLDGDGDCNYIGSILSTDLVPPSGSHLMPCPPNLGAPVSTAVSIVASSIESCEHGQGSVSVQTQDMQDPCACDMDGIIEGIETGRPTCKDHLNKGAGEEVCYVSMSCFTADKSTSHPGTRYRSCDPLVDNVFLTSCETCGLGYYSDTTSPLACVPCEAGTASPVAGSASAGSCQECGAGEFSIAGAGSCSPCPGGSYSPSLVASACFLCAANEYSSSEGATDSSTCLPCSPELPWAEYGSAACSPPPEICIQMEINACGVGDFSSMVSGVYERYAGECGEATSGRSVYYNSLTNLFVFHMSNSDRWKFGKTCGSDPIYAYAEAGSHPFVNTEPLGGCSSVAGEFEDRPMTIKCSMYEGQPAPCVPGTYDPSGSGIEGSCSVCPAHLEFSLSGSTSVDDCFTTRANVMSLSTSAFRVTGYNSDSDDHLLITEGGAVSEPIDLVFVTGSEILMTMYYNNEVVKMNVEGDVIGTFASVAGPYGITFLSNSRIVAVSSWASGGSIHFFVLDDFKNITLTESDAVGMVDMEPFGGGDPSYMTRGEHDDELLVTTFSNAVVRVCVPLTDCKPSLRNRIMMLGGGKTRGIGVIHSQDSYLVVDSYFNWIFRCPLAYAEFAYFNPACSIFAVQPTGVGWDPVDAAVDEDKRLVYVADRGKSIIHVFSLSGDYQGQLGQRAAFLSQPSAIAIKPGPLAAISPISPPPNATAGEPIIVGMALRTDTDKPLPPDYPIEEELHRFRIVATGTREGAATTLQGIVDSASELSIMIKYAGVWEVAITEGIKNPQHLKGSPFSLTVDPAETDLSECETEFESLLTAGNEFALVITTVDAFLNPTEGAEFEFSCCVGKAMTKAGEYLVDVTPAIKGNPFRFDVKPDTPDAATSAHNIAKRGIAGFSQPAHRA